MSLETSYNDATKSIGETVRSSEKFFARQEPESFFGEIESTPVGKRLEKLEKLIKAGALYEAYDYCNANMKWHTDRSSNYHDHHDQITECFYRIALGVRNSWDEPDKGWLNKALNQVQEGKTRFLN